MAIIASGLYGLTLEKMFNNTAALDLEAETYKGALFTDTVAPDFTADTAYGASPYDANETDGGSWPAAGVALVGTEITVAAGVLKFDATDVSVATTDITSAMGYLWHATGVAEEAILLVDFVTAVTTVNGTFEITWHGDGIFTLDYTP